MSQMKQIIVLIVLEKEALFDVFEMIFDSANSIMMRSWPLERRICNPNLKMHDHKKPEETEIRRSSLMTGSSLMTVE